MAWSPSQPLRLAIGFPCFPFAKSLATNSADDPGIGEALHSAHVDLFVPEMPLMAPAMLVSIILVLLSMQESRISSGALTGLNNRRRADSFLEQSIAQARPLNPIYLFIIDMNRFKAINDTYGHLEGDHALTLMADALRKSSAELGSFAARWGGDEFVMICAHGIGNGPEHVVGTIKQHLAAEADASQVAYELSYSVGYAACEDPNDDASSLVMTADKNLYTNKVRN